MFNYQSRKGFTLIELLVVIAIIAVLIGLLISAVQKVREAANELECKNNLKQIGLAWTNFSDAKNHFPTGGSENGVYPTFVNGKPAEDFQQSSGWAYQLLPFLEQENVYKGGGKTTDLEKGLFVAGTPIKQYFCPTRRRPTVIRWSDATYPPMEVALCDYAATAGTANTTAQPNVPALFSLTGEGWVASTISNDLWYVSWIDGPRDGVLDCNYYKQYKNFSNITDGTSYTMLIGEKCMIVDKYSRGTDDDNQGTGGGMVQDIVRHGNIQPERDFNMRGSRSWADKKFGSAHVVGFNAVSCDGSVRKVKYSIDIQAMRKFASINDGESFELN